MNLLPPYRILKVRALITLCCLASYCSATTVEISGLKKSARSIFLEKMAPRLEFINSRPATSWRADDASFFLKRLMIRAGYPDVEISWEIKSSSKILLNVIPNSRYYFGRVTATGTDILSPEEIQDYFFQPIIKTESVTQDRAPYIAEYKQRGMENVINYLKSKGYWTASVISFEQQTLKDRSRVDVTLSITPGKNHTIEPSEIKGASDLHLTALKKRLFKYTGRSASTRNLERLRGKVRNYYSENGYQLAKITMDVSHTAGRTIPSFTITEGERYKVKQVIVQGVEKTDASRIHKYYSAQEGQYFDQLKTDEITTSLLATGAFRSVTVENTPANALGDPLLNLHIRVKETKAKSFRSYTGYGSFDGFILGAGYTDRNYRGSLRSVYAGAEYSERGLLGELGITEPRLLNEPLSLTLRAYIHDQYNKGYDVRKTGLESTLTWEPNSTYKTRAYALSEYATSTSTSLTNRELGPNDYLLYRLGLEQTVDFRNNRLLPSAGYHGRTLAETGMIQGDAHNTFLRLETEHSYRYPIDKKNLLSARVKVSTLHSETSSDLPIDVRLFSGGINSQRGYNERELGPKSVSGDPVGGEAFWVSSLQYERKLSTPLKAIAFLDAGQLYSKYEELEFSSPSLSAGLGVKIDLPIGPVRIEYGHNLNQKKNEPAGTFHFTIGASF